MEAIVKKDRELSIRALIIGTLGSIVITTSSMYVALKMGALPWPTVFVTIVSMSLLKMMGGTNNREINIAHTTMSAGAMVAGGIAFTIPGIFIANPNAKMNIVVLLAIAVSGVILGIIATALMRKFFLEDNELPYPMGTAAISTIEAGDEGGKKAKTLFITMGLSVVFTALRDALKLIPEIWISTFLTAKNISFGFWFSPMAVGIGYIIGPLYTAVWFIGTALAFFVFMPVSTYFGFFTPEAADAFRSSIGIGLMVGTGFGVLIKGILPKLKTMIKSIGGGRFPRFLFPIISAVVVTILSGIAGLNILTSIILIFGTWFTTAMAASLTGQTGINPMEIFGVIILLLIKALGLESGEELFLVAATVAVAAGLCGDIFNDFKVGKAVGTKPKNQFIAESIGAFIGAFVSVGVLYILYRAYGAFGTGTPLIAPQAGVVAAMVKGLPSVNGFIIGVIVGFLLYILKIPAMTLGIGVYLPAFISVTVFIGGFIHFIVGKIKRSGIEKGQIIASGLLGGEGITAVIIAIARMFTGT